MAYRTLAVDVVHLKEGNHKKKEEKLTMEYQIYL